MLSSPDRVLVALLICGREGRCTHLQISSGVSVQRGEARVVERLQQDKGDKDSVSETSKARVEVETYGVGCVVPLVLEVERRKLATLRHLTLQQRVINLRLYKIDLEKEDVDAPCQRFVSGPRLTER